jgi:hypothetical protein
LLLLHSSFPSARQVVARKSFAAKVLGSCLGSCLSQTLLIREELHFERVMEEVLGKKVSKSFVDVFRTDCSHKGKAATIGALIFTQMGFATA